MFNVLNVHDYLEPEVFIIGSMFIKRYEKETLKDIPDERSDHVKEP